MRLSENFSRAVCSNRLTSIVLVVASTALLSCTSGLVARPMVVSSMPNQTDLDQPIESDGLQVSIVQLIAGAAEYNNKTIQVQGLFAVNVTGELSAAMFLDTESFRFGIYESAILVDTTGIDSSVLSALDGRYAIVVGRFRNGPLGDTGLFQGQISRVVRIQPSVEWNQPPLVPRDSAEE